MKVEFKVEQREIDRVLSDFGKMSTKVSEAILRQTAYAAEEVKRLAQEDVPVDNGILKNSIQIAVRKRVKPIIRGKGTIMPRIKYMVGTNLIYARTVEFGGGPRWVPIENLKKWAKRKLGDENAAYAIQKMIAKNGIKPKPFLRPAYQAVIPGYIESIKRIMRTMR